MSRLLTRTSQTAIDVFVLVVSFALAFMLRFDWSIPPDMTRRLFFTLPYVVLLQYGALLVFAVPRFSWRHVGLREVIRIAAALGTASILLLGARLLAAQLIDVTVQARYALVPIGAIAIDFLLAFSAVTGVRALRRITGEQADARKRRAVETSSSEDRKTIVIGAGGAGAMVLREISAHPQLGINVVGVVDDDPSKRGSILHGAEVKGTTTDLPKLKAELGATEAIIAIASAGGKDIRRISELCEAAGLRMKIVPGLSELVGGSVSLSRIRAVAIEDLLRRPPVSLDTDKISASLAGKVVLVTGAGGSIGSELCRQVCGYGPSKLVLVEQAENALFEIHLELRRTFPELDVVPKIADVVDEDRIRNVFCTCKPDFVLHAAAHKHVPMMEWNAPEAIKNNVQGTLNVARISEECGASAFVLISTDKAVRPTSVMGASKRVAELCVQTLAARSKTRFAAVRFGNVLGSQGSVVPIFKRQIAAGGPVTVTHPDMRRYFMTIPEACQLVLQASTMGAGGEIFILKMGQLVKIVDLARDLIRLSGLKPGEDVEITFTGMRPGEKMYEELTWQDVLDETRHSSILVEPREPPAESEVWAGVEGLVRAALNHDALGVREGLATLVPEFSGVSDKEKAS